MALVGSDGGQATIETVLILPVIILLALSMLQLGLFGRDVLLVESALRTAARTAAIAGSQSEAEQAARLAAPGLGTALRISVSQTGGQPNGCIRSVSAAFVSRARIPLIGGILGDLKIHRTASAPCEPHG